MAAASVVVVSPCTSKRVRAFLRATHSRMPSSTPSRHVKQVLPLLHQVQVNVGCQLKHLQHLVQHLPVLCRHAQPCFKQRLDRAFSAWYSGAILMASGRVPNTSMIFFRIHYFLSPRSAR
jgi:hypothetical protein